MASNDSNKGLPIPYVTAVWSGMSADDIEEGVAAGSILPPLEASKGGIDDSPAHSEVAHIRAKDGQVGDARARISGWFQALDPSLSSEMFDALWNHAGSDDDMRAETLRGYLSDTLLGDPSAASEDIDAFVADPGHRAQVVDLTGMTGADIAELAKTDIGYRHALATMQPLALTGNRELFARTNAAGALDRFDPDTGEQLMSDAWLGDRAKLLAWNATDSEATTIAGNQDWTFIDHTSVDENGDPAKVELRTGAENAVSNQVVFGGAEGELLRGVSGSDRMYGGAGDDILRGAGGADHLEGGVGDDLVIGGAGNDELTGDQGDDELEGGRGDDLLTAGAGADTLVGGRGNDRLEGGNGSDVYAIDEGDGADTILDGDGLGAIELDGSGIGGTMTAGQDGAWTSGDGRLSFAFAGEAGKPGTLTITGVAQERDDSAISNVITVRNWKNGDLGITLGDIPAETSAAGPNYDMQSITGPEVPLWTTEDMQGDPHEEQPAHDPSVLEEINVNDDVGWGDVGPVGSGTAMSTVDGSDSSTVTSGISAASMDPVPADLMYAVTEAPDIDSLQTDWSFSTALDSLLSDEAIDNTMLQPSDLESAIEAFSGVLEVPDVPASVGEAAAGGEVGDALTAFQYADAMAGGYGEAELSGEMAMAMSMPVVPDINTAEFARQNGSTLTGGVRNMQG